MKILSSKITYTCPILRIEERIVLKNGVEQTHWIVVRQPNVGIIALTEDNKVILTSERVGAEGKKVLGFPTGKMKNFEVTLEEAKKEAIIELEEEAGYQINFQEVSLLRKYKPTSNWYERDYYHFTGKGAKLKSNPKTDPAEEIETILVSIQELQELINQNKISYTDEAESVRFFLETFQTK